MKTIRIRQDGPDEHHVDDCATIQSILIDRGYYATLDQCYMLWKMHSECYGAGWLGLYEDKESVYEAIRSYFEQDSVLHQG